MRRNPRGRGLLLALPVLLLAVLACGASVFGTTSRAAVVACPPPEPRPWGWEGPRKPGCTCLDGTTECPDCWYALWEQEGGQPEPLRVTGTRFAFGEPVTLEPFTVRVHVSYRGSPVPGQQVAAVILQWGNPTTPLTPTDSLTPTLRPSGAVSITYQHVLHITDLEAPDGTRSSGTWTVSDAALAAVGLTLPTTIPMGDAVHIVPILVPDDRQVTELALTLRYLGARDGGDNTVTIRFARDQLPVYCP